MSRQYYGFRKAIAGMRKIDDADRTLRNAANYVRSQYLTADNGWSFEGKPEIAAALGLLADCILALPMPRTQEQIRRLRGFAMNWWDFHRRYIAPPEPEPESECSRAADLLELDDGWICDCGHINDDVDFCEACGRHFCDDQRL